MSFIKKKNKKEHESIPGVIDMTAYMDDDIIETDILGSYTGVPYQYGDDDDDYPVQDADDL